MRGEYYWNLKKYVFLASCSSDEGRSGFILWVRDIPKTTIHHFRMISEWYNSSGCSPGSRPGVFCVTSVCVIIILLLLNDQRQRDLNVSKVKGPTCYISSLTVEAFFHQAVLIRTKQTCVRLTSL